MKNNKGSEIITTPVVIAIGLILVSTLIVFCIKILMPYIWYEKLSSTCLKYVFVMEEYGYLTPVEKNRLLLEIEEQGFDKSSLSISCTSQRQTYGNRIYLNVNYLYRMELPVVGERVKKVAVNKPPLFNDDIFRY